MPMIDEILITIRAKIIVKYDIVFYFREEVFSLV